MIENLEVFGQLLLAVFLGAAIGLERELAHKKAGMRTFALVALGSCLFSIISKLGFKEFWGVTGFDPSRIASQIVIGIGFIGAGVIVMKQNDVRGITTAATLWVAAALGMAVGYKLYTVAVFTTLLTVAVLILFWFVESKMVSRASGRWGRGATEADRDEN